MKGIVYYSVLLLAGLLMGGMASGQYVVKGTVYDSSFVRTMEAVTVLSTSGKGTMTDASGKYALEVSDRDSVWFSYLGKPTQKFPVLKMPDPTRFDIALQTYNQVLDEVRIRNRSYRMDSLQNRADYAKIFNFRKPNIESITSIGPGGAAFDVQEIIRSFQFRRNRSTLRFQERLLQEEHDKYVDYRFNKGLVKRLTSLEGEALDRFMILYRPTYEFIQLSTEYDFQAYIRKAAEHYKKNRSF